MRTQASRSQRDNTAKLAAGNWLLCAPAAVLCRAMALPSLKPEVGPMAALPCYQADLALGERLKRPEAVRVSTVKPNFCQGTIAK